MEDILYKAVMAYIAANTTPITAKGLEAPKYQAWWTDQVAESLKEKDNNSLPYDCPALFYQFAPTKYHSENPLRVKASGELTIHLVQWRVGMEGVKSSETEAQFNLILQYAGALASILNGIMQTCAATLILAGIERDHSNNPQLHEKITFTWMASKKLANF